MLLFIISILTTITATTDHFIHPCTSSSQPIPFVYTGNNTSEGSTTASMCYDENTLHVEWECSDDEILATYTKCNDPLYHEDVVQLEVSPHGVLFFADITNPNGTCSSLGTFYYPCDFAAEYSAEITSAGWKAKLRVSLETIGRGASATTFLVNLFRIDKSSTNPTRYLSWQPTYTSPACFHTPSAFITCHLVT